MARLTPSEVAAATWIAGGVAATVALQAITDGEHSVSAGLRAHPVLTSCIGAVFACHLARRPRCLARLDPFSALAPVARALTPRSTP